MYFCLKLPSASSWGCELKCKKPVLRETPLGVSLFVRLWVEMLQICHLDMDVSVSLFVRLWVEIKLADWLIGRESSASSWGCELKLQSGNSSTCNPGQPLREAVSWNDTIHNYIDYDTVSLFVRLWVEIHLARPQWKSESRQPLREAVSWNMTGDYMVAVQEGQPLREAVSWNSLCQRNLTEKVGSASSWGCELKYYSLIITGKCFTVSLFVRLWVEMYDRGWNDALEKSASSWGCELK